MFNARFPASQKKFLYFFKKSIFLVCKNDNQYYIIAKK